MSRKINNLIIIIILLMSIYIVTSSAQNDFLNQLGDKFNGMVKFFPGGETGEHQDHYYLQISPNRTDVFRTKNITISYSLSLTNPTNKNINKSGLKFEHIIPEEFNFLSCKKCYYDKQNRKIIREGFNFSEDKPFEFSYNATISKTAPNGTFSLMNQPPRLTDGSESPLLNTPDTKINIMNNLPYLISPPYGSPKINKNIGKICRDTNITFFAEALDVEDKTLTYNWSENGNLFHSGKSKDADIFNNTFNYGNHNNFELVICDSSDCIKLPIDLQFNVEPKNEKEIAQELFNRRKDYNNSIMCEFLFVIIILFIVFTCFKNAFLSLRSVGFSIAISLFVYYLFYQLDKDLLMHTGIIELLLLSIIMPCAGYFIISGFSDKTPDLSARFGILYNKARFFFKYWLLYSAIQDTEFWLLSVPSPNGLLPTDFTNLPMGQLFYKLMDILKSCLTFESVIKINLNTKGFLNKIPKKIRDDVKNWSIWYATMFAMFFIITILVLVIPLLSPLSDTTTDAKYNHIWLYYSMMTQTFGAILAIIAMVAVAAASNENRQRCTQITPKKIKYFVILYSIIILASIFGMATRVAPNLDPSVSMGSPIDLVPLIIFVISLLLSVPAVVCLGKLIFDFFSAAQL